MADARQCQNAKIVIAAETGRIQMTTERALKSHDGFALKIIKQGKYESGMGSNPRSIRYSDSRPQQAGYQEFLQDGDEERDFPDTDCGGNPATIASTAVKNAMACDTPATRIYLGFDEFNRTVKRTAYESDIHCITTMLEKHNPAEYLARLRNSMARWGVDAYENELRRDIVKLSAMKFSITESFFPQEGTTGFSVLPTGTLNINYLRRIAYILKANGYEEGSGTPRVNGHVTVRVHAGWQAIERAIEDHKKQRGLELQSKIDVPDSIFGMTTVHDMFQFVSIPFPVRGYLAKKADNSYEFVQVFPTKNRAGDGGGIVEEVNQDYYNCRVTCNGVKHVLYELGYVIHPKAMERQAFALPALGKAVNSRLYNFEVRVLDGDVLWDGCNTVKNEDGLKFKIKMNHAYAPFSMNPELMTAIMYRAIPEQIVLSEITCNDDANCPPEDEITIQEPKALQGCDDGCTDDSQELPYEATGAGEVRVVYAEVSVCPGVRTICFERITGHAGAITIDVDTADGTAAAPGDYTAIVAQNVTWADGEWGVKCVNVTIEDAAVEKDFTVVISNNTAGTLGNDTTTVNVLSAAECCIEEEIIGAPAAPVGAPAAANAGAPAATAKQAAKAAAAKVPTKASKPVAAKAPEKAAGKADNSLADLT